MVSTRTKVRAVAIAVVILTNVIVWGWFAFLLSKSELVGSRRPRTIELSPDEKVRVQRLKATIETLRPLHQKLGEPQPGDWLAEHNEAGQTFDDYLGWCPDRPRADRPFIYIQPLGEFTEKQREIVTQTGRYMEAHFCMPVKVNASLPLSDIPPNARRTHPEWGVEQVLTSHVLLRVLGPRLPEDARVFIGLTAVDLWAGRGWNFVFGEAVLGGRVGVWSLYRFGDPGSGEEAFRTCLRRMLKISVHETGHIFAMRHCTLFECNMCGSNNLPETDRHPLWLCPECMAKLCFARRADPAERYKTQAEVCRTLGLEAEAAFLEKSIKALQRVEQ
ncbi:MAG: archaemetzincin [Planctomycetota bacterium]